MHLWVCWLGARFRFLAPHVVELGRDLVVGVGHAQVVQNLLADSFQKRSGGDGSFWIGGASG